MIEIADIEKNYDDVFKYEFYTAPNGRTYTEYVYKNALYGSDDFFYQQFVAPEFQVERDDYGEITSLSQRYYDLSHYEENRKRLYNFAMNSETFKNKDKYATKDDFDRAFIEEINAAHAKEVADEYMGTAALASIEFDFLRNNFGFSPWEYYNYIYTGDWC